MGRQSQSATALARAEAPLRLSGMRGPRRPLSAPFPAVAWPHGLPPSPAAWCACVTAHRSKADATVCIDTYTLDTCTTADRNKVPTMEWPTRLAGVEARSPSQLGRGRALTVQFAKQRLVGRQGPITTQRILTLCRSLQTHDGARPRPELRSPSKTIGAAHE